MPGKGCEGAAHAAITDERRGLVAPLGVRCATARRRATFPPRTAASSLRSTSSTSKSPSARAVPLLDHGPMAQLGIAQAGEQAAVASIGELSIEQQGRAIRDEPRELPA